MGPEHFQYLEKKHFRQLSGKIPQGACQCLEKEETLGKSGKDPLKYRSRKTYQVDKYRTTLYLSKAGIDGGTAVS